jgi:hypothetical protein
MLKPIVLKGLQLAHQEEQNTASSEQQVRSISRGIVDSKCLQIAKVML